MAPDYREYQVYRKLCKLLDKKMRAEIDTQYTNLRARIKDSMGQREEHYKEIREQYIPEYKEQVETVRQELYNAGPDEKAECINKLDFYQGIIEEMTRMLPIDEQSKLSDHHQEWDHHDIHRTEEPQPVNHQAEPPRYLDPTTYQPIAQPQPGQQVFDTKMQQMIVYYPAGAGMPGSQPGYPGGTGMPGVPGGQPGYPGGTGMPGMPGSQPGYPQGGNGMPGSQPVSQPGDAGMPSWGNPSGEDPNNNI